MARPSEYDYKLSEEICELVACGSNLMDALSSDNRFPSWPTFRRWKAEHSELRTLYVNSVQDKSEPLLKEMDEIGQDLRNGVIDASTANVLIQTLKWKLAKFYPKMFGDNKTVDLTTLGQSIQAPIQWRKKD